MQSWSYSFHHFLHPEYLWLGTTFGTVQKWSLRPLLDSPTGGLNTGIWLFLSGCTYSYCLTKPTVLMKNTHKTKEACNEGTVLVEKSLKYDSSLYTNVQVSQILQMYAACCVFSHAMAQAKLSSISNTIITTQTQIVSIYTNHIKGLLCLKNVYTYGLDTFQIKLEKATNNES